MEASVPKVALNGPSDEARRQLASLPIDLRSGLELAETMLSRVAR